MRKIIVALILALVLACLIGCGPQPPAAHAEPVQEANITKMLPHGYTNLKKLGNQWFSYDLEVGGKKRQFMVRYSTGSHGEYSLAVTELHEGK
jgi:predicted small lipoprotein YifL